MNSSQFLARRRADPRFTNERRVVGVSPTMASSFEPPKLWYEEAPRDPPSRGLKRTTETFAMKKGADGKMRLTEGETSDGTDSGVCWSDKERVPGTKEGEPGSCRPKRKKKAKTEAETKD